VATQNKAWGFSHTERCGKAMGFPRFPGKIIYKWWVFHIFLYVKTGENSTVSQPSATASPCNRGSGLGQLVFGCYTPGLTLNSPTLN